MKHIRRFSLSLLAAAILAGCAFGQVPERSLSDFSRMTIYTVTVPPAVQFGAPGETYQVWIHGGDADTVAYQVSIKYIVNGSTFAATTTNPALTGGWTNYYCGISVFTLPLGSVVTNVVVGQLKPSASQEFQP